MKSYILFIYGTFEDHQEIEFFCMEILATSNVVKSLKYVIESSQNIIVIFDSDLEHKDLSVELHNLMGNETIKFYFMFERDSLVTAHLPEKVKDFIFKPLPEINAIKVDYIKTPTEKLDLDEVLDKIEQFGIDSLTEDEKNFLDNFDY